jgi:leader peptidase (prepilin peptidase)/N-methyltransferase
MDLLWLALFILLGMCFGSFLNVAIDRLPQGKSLIKPPSHCDFCQRRLTALDMIPVLSYLLLRGRCRSCGAAIPLRVLLVEIGTAVMFGFFYWHFGAGVELAVAFFYGCLFLVIGIIDIQKGLILNVLIYPAMILALVFALFLSDIAIVPDLANAAIGGGIGLALFTLIFLASRGGMGMGDIKMAALIGLVIGFPHLIVALLLAIIAGGLVATLLLVSKRKGRKQSLPFGPFLSFGALIALSYGAGIYDWYINLF